MQSHDEFSVGSLPNPAKRRVTNIAGHISSNASTGKTGKIAGGSWEQNHSLWGKIALAPDHEAVAT